MRVDDVAELAPLARGARGGGACEGRELRNIVNAQHLRLRTFVDVHGREYSPSAARRR